VIIKNSFGNRQIVGSPSVPPPRGSPTRWGSPTTKPFPFSINTAGPLIDDVYIVAALKSGDEFLYDYLVGDGILAFLQATTYYSTAPDGSRASGGRWFNYYIRNNWPTTKFPI
jgi:hypothetical protein